jgi:tRNA threonylcarbamoyladenosine biosynthesis protein TsaB
MEISTDPRFLSRGVAPGPLLVLDTSTDRAAVALAVDDRRFSEAPAGLSRQHGRGLIASIRDLLRGAGVRLEDLMAVGVGIGPGSFTGLRIGLTAAKTLAYAVGRPLVSFDSLEATARNAPASALRVVAVADAQRGDLFVADFAREMEGAPLVRTAPTRLERADSWPATLPNATFVIGPPLGRAEPSWPSKAVRSEGALGYPGGRPMVDLVRERMAGGIYEDPWFLEPAYARGSAAEEKAGARR